MTKKVFLKVFFMAICLRASVGFTYDKVVFINDMDIQGAQGNFLNIKNVNMALKSSPEQETFTNIYLEMEYFDKQMPVRVIELDIKKVEYMDCGFKYYAEVKPNYKKVQDASLSFGGRNFIEHKITVELTQHSSSSCEYQTEDNIFIAKINEGYGWAKKLYDTMEVIGEVDLY